MIPCWPGHRKDPRYWALIDERNRRWAVSWRRRRRAVLARCGRRRPSRLGPPRWKADQVYRRIAFRGMRSSNERKLAEYEGRFAMLLIRPRLHRRRAA